MSRYYCAPCLNEQKALGDKGHISKVTNISRTTSTGTLSLHLSVKHNISEITEPRIGKIMNYLRKYDNCATGTTMSSHELNRDLTIWFCRDLLPFKNVAKDGKADFFHKVFSSIELPSPTTLASIALDDVYRAVHFIVKDMISDTKSICLLFDGWTDKHKARFFLGIRASFIKNWTHRIVTLSCHVLQTHTNRDVSEHVSMVLCEFVGDDFAKSILLSACHKGAAIC